MNIVNVIVNENGFVKSIDSFGILNEQESRNVKNHAEEFYIEKCVSISERTDIDADDMREHITDQLELGSTNFYFLDKKISVSIEYSYLSNIQF